MASAGVTRSTRWKRARYVQTRNVCVTLGASSVLESEFDITDWIVCEAGNEMMVEKMSLLTRLDQTHEVSCYSSIFLPCSNTLSGSTNVNASSSVPRIPRRRITKVDATNPTPPANSAADVNVEGTVVDGATSIYSVFHSLLNIVQSVKSGTSTLLISFPTIEARTSCTTRPSSSNATTGMPTAA